MLRREALALISVPLFTEYEDVLARPQVQRRCSLSSQEQQVLFDALLACIRLSDTKHERLKAFARPRGVSVNSLVEELATVALAQADAENRHLLRQASDKPAAGLRLLDKLDRRVR